MQPNGESAADSLQIAQRVKGDSLTGCANADGQRWRAIVTVMQTGTLAAMFHEARTFTRWQPRPISEALVEAAFELARLGPTSGNCQPLRLVLACSRTAKERLLPRLYPHTDARGWFTTDAALAEQTAFRNSSQQGAYFILALRAQGLDCGPMSGFDAAKVAVAFFSDGRYRTNFLLNIGFGEHDTLRPRRPRLRFDEFARWE